MWGKLLFLLIWPVSVPYGLYWMWKGDKFSRAVRIGLTGIAASFFIVAIATASPNTPTPPQVVQGPAVSRPSAAPVPEAPAAPAPEPATTTAPAPEPEPAIVAVPGTVVRVVDGDTAIFRLDDGTEETVRFIGVDTPESTNSIEVYGEEASDYTTSALPEGTQVFLEKDAEDRDQYGRLLAYVWLAQPTAITETEIRDKMFNARLATDGYAQQMTIQPNSKYAEYFTTFVSEARTAETGLWSPSVLAATEAANAPAPKPKAKPKPAPKASGGGGGTVYITDTGSKYHSSGCSYLRKSKHAISLSSAKSQGYSACSRCDP
jgi:micrococcal nuclease